MAWSKTQADRQRDAQVYGDPEYQANKKLVRQRSGGRCEIQAEGICTGRAESCDHTIPVSQGGTHALTNLRDACGPCHRRKTAQEGAGFRRQGDPEPLQSTAW
jgi:5-methylcytosine-specific restriction endonuclease McrA